MSTAARRLPQLPLDDSDLPALIVLGRDDANKPHAAWFDNNEATAGRAAAKGMGMMALAVTTDEVRKLADQIAHGKIFNSGKAFVPFTKLATYDALIAHVPVADQVRPMRIVRSAAEDGSDANNQKEPPAAAPDEKAANNGPVLTVPQDWSKVGPGCVVLAVADEKADGWFEAVILKSKGNSSYVLRWRDYPEEPHFERAPVGLALMHPSRKATD